MYRNSVFFATVAENWFLKGVIRGHFVPGFGWGNEGPEGHFPAGTMQIYLVLSCYLVPVGGIHAGRLLEIRVLSSKNLR